MALTVAIQMDPIERIDIGGDSTFALALEAEKRGHAMVYYGPRDLSFRDGKVTAHVRSLNVRAVKGDHFTLGDFHVMDLSKADVVLMRQDPPFDMAYITTTHFLDAIHPKTLVVNNPTEVRNAPEKLYVTTFEGVQPPTLITSDTEALYDFRARHGDIVLKPLYGGGGSGVARLLADDPNLDALLDLHRMIGREPVIAQKFIPAVTKGDKRILLVDGEPVGAINRVPAPGQIRSNLAVGGRADAVDLTSRDLELCAIIGPQLRARGLLFVGVDVIGDYLTEINVTSPTGARALKHLSGIDAITALWDVIEKKRAGG